MDDIELLRRYVETGSEEAFSTLVSRHIDFVYAAALRQVRGTHRAEDVAQAVFTDLARKARELCRRTELVGWLYLGRVTRRGKWCGRSAGRRAKERLNARRTHVGRGTDSRWATLRPLIERRLHDLDETDSTAILRRFSQRFVVDIAAVAALGRRGAKRVDRRSTNCTPCSHGAE